MKVNIGNDLYLKGRIGWRGLSKNEYLDSSDYRIINGTALLDDKVNWDNCGYISKARFEESQEIILQENDILISKDGTIGKIGFVKNKPKNVTVASGIFVLRNTRQDILDTTYLYHFLKSNIFKDFIARNKAQGSTINHLYQRDLAMLDLHLPPLKEQQKIGRILSNIDEKIAVNNEINKLLEQSARAIYEYYFVQFDFPNANGKPYKSSGGEMTFNEILNRPISKDFEVKNLLDIIEWTSGAQPPKSTFIYKSQKGYVRFIQNRDYGSDSHITYIKDSPNNKICNEFDIMIDKYGEAGKVRFGLAGAYNVALSKISVKIDNAQEYVRKFLESDFIYNYLHNACIASTRASLNESLLGNLNIVIPNQELLKEFEKTQKQYIKTILYIKKENEKLKALRDFLLPLLLNAQARI